MPILELEVASGESLSVRRFTVREAISEPFEIVVVARSEDPSLDLDGIVGRRASFRLVTGVAGAHHPERQWTGVCRLAEQEQVAPNGLSTYRFHLVPALWLMTQRRDHRIFQHRSAPAIAAAMLERWGIAGELAIDPSAHPALPYKVQYGETDYAFFCRILEEAGIAFTLPDGERGRVALHDRLHAGPPRTPAIVHEGAPNEAAEREFVTEVRFVNETRPGTATTRDHDLRRPDFALFGQTRSGPSTEASLEQYVYRPGGSLRDIGSAMGTGEAPVADDEGSARHDPEEARRGSQRLLESLRADKRVVLFRTNALDPWPGRVFSITDHPHPDVCDKPLLVTELSLEGAPGEAFVVRGRAVFADVPFRPLRRTPAPRARVQSATVVGGEEIHPDELGRVRVRFPWDRTGESTCWVRVSQSWAGGGFGMIALPRAGQEVLVDFLGGDPEQPVVVGRAFNLANPVVERLPEADTRSALKSDVGGGFNEILFDDAKGSELVYAQAERDARRLVKNDETSTVGHDRRKDVGGDELETTDGNRVQETKGDRVELSFGDRTTAVDGTKRDRVDGRSLERVEGDRLATVGKDQHLVTHGVRRERIEHHDHLIVEHDRPTSVGGTDSLTVGKALNESVGSYSVMATGPEGWIHLIAGSSIVIESSAQSNLVAGGNFIAIDSNVTIVGSTVAINEDGDPADAPGPGPKLPERPTEPTIAEPPPPPTTTDASCCGCVLRVSIGNVRAVGETPATYGGKTSFHGHAFDFTIEMDFKPGAGAGISDCKLEWWETNSAPSGWIQKNVETDMYAEFPVSDTFKPWNDRKIPCPGGGPLTITITDFPSLATRSPQATGTRVLKFRLVVKSGVGCSCGLKSATATATQILTLEHGKLVFQDFKIGPSSTT